MTVAIIKTKRGMGSEILWDDIKEEWISSRLGIGRGLTHEELAKKWGVAAKTIRNRSSVGNWKAQLEKRIEERDTQVAQKMKEASEQAITKLQQDFVGSEVEIRRRHAMISRTLQAKAMKKINSVELDKLSVRDAIALLDLGLKEERRALGYKDTYEKPEGSEDGVQGYSSLNVKSEQHKQIQEMGMTLLNALQQKVSAMHAETIEVRTEEPEPAAETVALSQAEINAQIGL